MDFSDLKLINKANSADKTESAMEFISTIVRGSHCHILYIVNAFESEERFLGMKVIFIPLSMSLIQTDNLATVNKSFLT